MGEIGKTWKQKTGLEPGAKKLASGHKAYQNEETIKCPECQADTGKRENLEVRFSDFCREFNIRVRDFDFIGHSIGFTYTNLESTHPNYLAAVDRRKRKGEYQVHIQDCKALDKIPIVCGITIEGRVCYKDLRNGVDSPWEGPVSKEEFAARIKHADELKKKKAKANENKQPQSQVASVTG